MAEIKPEEMKPDWEHTENFDAEVVKEAIAEGDQPSPDVDVASDYEASKQMSEGIVDAETAEKMTEPQFQVTQPRQENTIAQSSGNPDDYIEMAKDVSPAPEGAGNVTDDLVDQAIAKGKSSQK